MSTLESQADLLFNNLAGWETDVLKRMGKRIGKIGKMSLADVKTINNIVAVKQDMAAVTKELAEITGYDIAEVEKMYADLLAEQHLANKPLYDYRNRAFVPFEDNIQLQAIAKAYATATDGTMINLSKTSVLKMIDENGVVRPMQQAYVDVLDKATMQVATGTTDFHTAMRESIKALGGNGIRVDYGNGYTRRMDTAIRQEILYGAKQASVAYNELIGQELGCDGYEIDYHANPRPSHIFMQGKQYVIGKTQTINGIEFVGFDEPDPESDDKLSASKALEQYNCYHYKTPIICGISEPRYSKSELAKLNEQNKKTYEIDGKKYTGYEVTQAQRRIETAVREQKSIKAMAQADGDDGLVKECNAKIKAYQNKYDRISEKTGITGDKKRMSVVRSGK